MKMNFSKVAILATALLVLSACSSRNDEPIKDKKAELLNEPFRATLNQYVRELPTVQQKEPFAERLFKGEQARSATLFDDSFRAASGFKREYEQAKEVEEQLLFSDANELFYPGSLIKAASVIDGDYNPIITDRRSITISTSLSGGAKTSIKVEDPKLSTVRDAMSELLSRDFNAPPADFSYESVEVHDEQHLKLALGASYKGTVAEVSGTASFKYDSDKKYFIIKAQQVFYTLDIDIPKQASDFFVKDFNYKNLFGEEKPLYISSIKYGRILLLGIETTMSKADLDSKFNLAFKEKITAEAEAAYKEIREKSTIKGRIIGGNAQLAGESIADIENIKKFLRDGATYGKDNLGAPIAYQLRELGTNKLFKTVIYSRYKKNEDPKEKISFELFVDEQDFRRNTGESLDLVGRIFLVRKGLNGEESRRELYFEWIGNKHFIHPKISAYESGEELFILLDRKHYPDDRQEYRFKLPSAETLIKKAKETKSGYHLYDKDWGEPLILKDTKEKFQITLEMEKQKILKP